MKILTLSVGNPPHGEMWIKHDKRDFEGWTLEATRKRLRV